MSQKIGTELKIKAGETVSSGRLKITYVGILNEENRTQNLNLNPQNIESFFFEIKDTNEIYKRKGNDVIFINDLVIKIIKEKSDGSAVTIMVLNKEMTERLLEKDIMKLKESYDSTRFLFERLDSLIKEPAPNFIWGNLYMNEKLTYFTFSKYDDKTDKDTVILKNSKVELELTSVLLNGVELKDNETIDKFWIKSYILKNANSLRLYYRGEIYTANFEIELTGTENHYSFIIRKVEGKKILWKTK